MTFELQTKYDSRKDFYGKAITRFENGKLILKSYNTDVAEIENGQARVFGLYSQTTTRHIKEFLKQNGFKAENSKQIMQDYGKDKLKKQIKSSGVLNVTKETRVWS